MSHGTRHSDVHSGENLAPFMIHELLLSPTETASGIHPCCVVSVASFTAVTRVQSRRGRQFKTNNFQRFAQKLVGTKRHNFSGAIRTLNLGDGFLSSVCIREELSDDRGLSRSLRRGYGLRVRVECHARGRVSKQLLHYLDVRSTRL